MRRRDAHARIRNRRTESEWVDAGSLSKIATLGVRSGDEVEVRVSGSQAAETLDHILSLAARNFDESAVDAAPAPEPAVRQRRSAPALGWVSDRPVRRGCAPSPSRTPPPRSPRSSGAGSARRSRRSGARISQLRTRTAREVGEAEAAIFDAHQLLLDDAALLDDARGRIDDGQSAVSAWSAAVKRLAAEFAAVPDPYLQARADDVRAVGDQVLRAMLGTSESSAGPTGVLVAADLTPAEAAELDPSRVAAVLLAFGSPHAHNVILLRAKGIPVIVGAGPTVLSIPDGTVVAVDGGRGEYVVDPPEEVRAEFQARVATLAQRQRQAHARAAEPAVTRDGITVAVGANVGSVDDARAAAAHGADFAGLGAHRVPVPRPPGRAGCRGAVRRVPQDRRIARRAANHVAHPGCRR